MSSMLLSLSGSHYIQTVAQWWQSKLAATTMGEVFFLSVQKCSEQLIDLAVMTQVHCFSSRRAPCLSRNDLYAFFSAKGLCLGEVPGLLNKS